MSDFNSSLPIRTETNGDVAARIVDGTITSQALAVDASGKITTKLDDAAGNGITSTTNGGHQSLDVNATNLPLNVDTNYGVVGASTVRTASEIGNATGAADFNFGTVGAQTLRTAAEVGNATGAASFNAGATGAQTLRVASNLYDSTGTPFSSSNPLPVTIDTVSGTSVNDFKDASAVGIGSSDNHDYTVTAGKTLYFDQVNASGSGKAKLIVQVETGVATGVFTSYFTQFNSTAETNMVISLNNPISVAAGVRVRATLTNLDKAAQDLYSTISGHEN